VGSRRLILYIEKGGREGGREGGGEGGNGHIVGVREGLR